MTHPAKLVMGDDEDYAEYLFRQSDAWSLNPPPAPDGFTLVDCDAQPRHWPVYTVTDDDFYEMPCPHCVQQIMMEEHQGCRHKQHRAWRRWKPLRRVASFLYTSGLTSSGPMIQWGGGCDGCVTMPTWDRRKRHYVLWVSRDTWRCLLQGRHLPGDPVFAGLCSKCLPCPECGSKTAGHEPGCEYA